MDSNNALVDLPVRSDLGDRLLLPLPKFAGVGVRFLVDLLFRSGVRSLLLRLLLAVFCLVACSLSTEVSLDEAEVLSS